MQPLWPPSDRKSTYPTVQFYRATSMVAWALVERSVLRRDLLIIAVFSTAAVLVAALASQILMLLGEAPPGSEYGIQSILRYFEFIQFTDVRRLLYVLIPAGIFPLFVALAWRLHDRQTRVLALVTLAYFLFFFVQAYVSLHHFVPAMVLPIVIAFRQVLRHPSGPPAARWWCITAVAAVALAFPWGHLSIHREGREVGRAVAVEIPGYAQSDPAAMRASTLLDRLFLYDWDEAVPRQYGGSPLVWNYYARHGTGIDASTNYLVQPATSAVADGWRLIGTGGDGAALYVRSDAVWQTHRSLRPPTPAGSSFLTIPRGVLFPSNSPPEGVWIIGLGARLRSLRTHFDSLLQSIGG